MIVDTFLVESHLAEVLFDTGATHLFITASWVEAHNLRITNMTTPIQIDSASGKVRADSVCLNVSVEIRGIEFPANLIVMGTQGIDVILGILLGVFFSVEGPQDEDIVCKRCWGHLRRRSSRQRHCL
jgi:predicted aspartyl protease